MAETRASGILDPQKGPPAGQAANQTTVPGHPQQPLANPRAEQAMTGDRSRDPEVDPNTGLPPVEGKEFVPEPDTGVQPDGTMPDEQNQVARDKDRAAKEAADKKS
jgi:hypothetical protein